MGGVFGDYCQLLGCIGVEAEVGLFGFRGFYRLSIDNPALMEMG